MLVFYEIEALTGFCFVPLKFALSNSQAERKTVPFFKSKIGIFQMFQTCPHPCTTDLVSHADFVNYPGGNSPTLALTESVMTSLMLKNLETASNHPMFNTPTIQIQNINITNLWTVECWLACSQP